MTPRNLRNIHTTRNSCRDALPCANMALKLPRYFYLLMEKPLGRYFQVRSPYYQAAQCNQKTPIPISSRWQVRSNKTKTSINTNHSCHHSWSNNKVRFSFNKPNRKGWGVKLVDVVNYLPHKVFCHHSWSNNKVRFSFNKPNRKRWGVKLVDVVNYLPHKVFLWHHH